PSAAPSTVTPTSAEISDDGLSEAELTIARVLSAPHETVTSPDGAAALLVPASALTGGVDVSSLTITAEAPSESPATIGGNPPAASYRLEPDGTTFSEPVVVRMT